MVAEMDGPETVSVPNHPKDASRGTRTLTLSSTIFIELADFRPAPEHKTLRHKQSTINSKQ